MAGKIRFQNIHLQDRPPIKTYRILWYSEEFQQLFCIYPGLIYVHKAENINFGILHLKHIIKQYNFKL